MSDSTPKRILFLDITAPAPYDAGTLKTKAQGGTESTVTRIAEALAEDGLDVTVAQGVRTGLESGEGKANYVSFEALQAIKHTPHAVVALRTSKLIPFIIKQWGGSPKLLLWAHDFNERELIEDYVILESTGIKVLGVSRTHKTLIASAFLSSVQDVKGITVDYVYNPVSDTYERDETPVDNNKLVFFSSPHKGLVRTLEVFERLREMYPEYKLYVANPGYVDNPHALPEGIINLGELPHAEMMQHVRSAFAVLHLNTVFPETFGLVYAEANAVGTPCITHRLAATSEVLNPAESQIVDCRDTQKVIERIELWRGQGRPQVSLKPEFKLSNVLAKWKALLK